jgi:tungstate transport system ATP-binding protein
MTEAIFTLSAVEKRYNRSTALKLRQLTIQKGELTLLTGPNGSGKSTLLNILALLTKPDQGQMIFAGETVSWRSTILSRLRKRITLMHQSPYLFQGTVYDNICFGLSIRGIRGSAAQHTAAEALDMVGLSGFGTRTIDQLSGGEAQRTALARALAIRPELLLLDEPLANVDRESTRVLEEVIVSLPGKGTSVVMSSHDLDLHARLPCRIIALLDGQVCSSQPSNITQPLPAQESSTCQTLKMHAA